MGSLHTLCGQYSINTLAIEGATRYFQDFQVISKFKVIAVSPKTKRHGALVHYLGIGGAYTDDRMHFVFPRITETCIFINVSSMLQWCRRVHNIDKIADLGTPPPKKYRHSSVRGKALKKLWMNVKLDYKIEINLQVSGHLRK